MLNGIAPQQIVGNLPLLKEYPISNDENPSANVGIVLSLEDKDKTNQAHSELENKRKVRNMIPTSDFGESRYFLTKPFIEKTQRVVYVTLLVQWKAQCAPFGND
jgi:hypothetical protein